MTLDDCRLFYADEMLWKLKSVRTDPHEREGACLAHRANICLSTADPPSLEQGEQSLGNEQPETEAS
jgi:hypothetical protein